MLKSVVAISLALALTDVALAEPSEEPAATPQRPSVSFGTATVPDRGWELESGGVVVDAGAAIPLYLKYGLTDRTELAVGLDAVRQVEAPSGTTSSVGDLTLGIRSRFWQDDRNSAAVVGWLKVPTAPDDVGTGEPDAGVVGIYSTSVSGVGIDTNLWVSALGTPDGSTLGQVQGVVAAWIPTETCWTPFVELAGQKTASIGSGGFANTGASCTISRTSVVDAAVGAGWGDGYSDWVFTVGWTVLWDPPRRPRY